MMVFSRIVTVCCCCVFFARQGSAKVVFAGDDNVPKSADFVIVGGGTAGCVMAARLCTELPGAKIVLLERSIPRSEGEDFYVSAPRFGDAIYLDAGPAGVDVFNYFPSEPNPRLTDPETGEPGRIIDLIEGATIGGTSNVAFQWSYPVSGTVDTWGINGLDTARAKELFLKVADVVKPIQPPQQLRQDYYEDSLNAFAEANYTIKDKQVPGEGGFTTEINFLTVDEKGRRRSAYTQYLLPVLGPVCADSLTVVMDSLATKIFSSTGDLKIDTVEFASSAVSRSGLANEPAFHTIQATQEIILSAGPYGSPKLLLQSGIGPSDDLEERGVKSLVDLPVGKRTKLRPLSFALGRFSGRPLPRNTNTSLLTERAAREFLREEGGPFAVAVSATLGKRDREGYHSSAWGSVFEIDAPILSLVCYLNSKAFGNLTIVDGGDPFADVIVNTNVFSDPEDFQSAVTCVEEFRDIIRKNFPGDFNMTEFPLFNSTRTVEDWISATSLTSWHFVGGSAVGTVLNGDLQLLGGIKGVRVVDSSVIPELPVSAGPLSSVYMLAEFVSEAMVKEYSKSFGSQDVAEFFPLALSLVCLSVATVFSVWVVVGRTSLSREKVPTEVGSEDASKRASFRSGFQPTVLLSWSNVSCSYSKSSIQTLKSCSGLMRANELTACMGSR